MRYLIDDKVIVQKKFHSGCGELLKPGYTLKVLVKYPLFSNYTVAVTGNPFAISYTVVVSDVALFDNCILQTASKTPTINWPDSIYKSMQAIYKDKSNPNDILTAGDQTDFFGDYDISISDEETTKIYPIKCECGVSSIGGGNHSTWCPIKNE